MSHMNTEGRVQRLVQFFNLLQPTPSDLEASIDRHRYHTFVQLFADKNKPTTVPPTSPVSFQDYSRIFGKTRVVNEKTVGVKTEEGEGHDSELVAFLKKERSERVKIIGDFINYRETLVKDACKDGKFSDQSLRRFLRNENIAPSTQMRIAAWYLKERKKPITVRDIAKYSLKSVMRKPIIPPSARCPLILKPNVVTPRIVSNYQAGIIAQQEEDRKAQLRKLQSEKEVTKTESANLNIKDSPKTLTYIARSTLFPPPRP